jgi:TonB family protein
MTASPTIATMYSADRKLAFLDRVEQNQANADEDLPIYSVRSSTGNIGGLQASDIVIYDIDIAEGNITQVIEDVLHLRLSSQGCPLVLTGSRDSLAAVMNSEIVKSEVSSVITKPWIGTQLNIVVQASVTKKADETFVATKPIQPIYKWLGIGSALALTAGAFFSVSLGNAKPESGPAQLESKPLVEQIAYQPSGQNYASDSRVESEARISQLIAKANNALLKGQIVFPEGDNALSYFDKALDLDAYHTVAYTGRQDLLNSVRLSVDTLIEDGQLVAANRLFDVLKDAEAYSDDNRRITRLLNEAGAKHRSSNKPLAPKRKAVLTPVKEPENHVDPTPSKAIFATTVALSKLHQEAVISDVKPILDGQKARDIKDIVITQRAGPKYPRLATNKKIEGWVEVGFQVNEKGEAINVHVVDAHPANVFDKSSVRAVEKWKFQPAEDIATGQTVISAVNVTKFTFNL